MRKRCITTLKIRDPQYAPNDGFLVIGYLWLLFLMHELSVPFPKLKPELMIYKLMTSATFLLLIYTCRHGSFA